MAANASKTPLLRLLTKRSFAASANPAVNPASNIQVSTLPNKLVVASADSIIPGIVKISVAFRAGSRYEKEENLGASHILRAACGLGTRDCSQFSITRNLQMIGAGLSASGCRETIVYTLETTTDHLENSLCYLKAVAAEHDFKPWELKDNIPRIKHELHSLPPQAILFDLVHYAAYRKTLGNSIFAREHRIPCIGSETLHHFVNENFKGNKASVAGVGICHDNLVDFANQLDLQTGGSDSAPAKYYGGEVRKETPGDHSFVMIAGESSSLLKKEVFTWGVLAKALGSQPQIKYGQGSSPLAKVASTIPASNIVAVHIPHSDSGLFGIAVSTHSHYSGQAVDGVVKAIKGNLTDADVARGKAILKQEILSSGDCVDSLLAELAYQSLLVGSVSSPGQLAAAVDSVTTSQVQEALKKFASSKKSMAAIGNIHNTPYLDDIQ